MLTSEGSSSCLPSPTATSVATISSPADLGRPTPSSFVTRSGTQLELDGEPFVAVGPNAYWLGEPHASRSRVLEAIAVASAMGATTIRSHTLGISTGTKQVGSLLPDLGVYDDTAFVSIDWALYAARLYGLRVIVPLTDQYDYNHGGLISFLRMRNLTAVSSLDFYPFYDTSSVVFEDFKGYVSHLLTHRSNLTGLTMAEDPTVLAFETGNELSGYSNGQQLPTADWTTQISSHIKSLAPNTLILSGSYGVQQRDLGIEQVDIVSNHYYPLWNGHLLASARDATAGGKVFIAGEYDWTDKSSPQLLFLSLLIFAVLAAAVFALPKRWFPISCCCGRRRKATTPGDSPMQLTSSSDVDDFKTPGSSRTPPTSYLLKPMPALPPPSRRGVRKWHVALAVLLLAPAVAGGIFVSLPSLLWSFLATADDLASANPPQLAGQFYWSLFGLDDTCCAYYEHNDGFTLHYPAGPGINGGSPRSQVLRLMKNAYGMRGMQQLPWGGRVADLSEGNMPIVACPQASLPIPANVTWTGGDGSIEVD